MPNIDPTAIKTAITAGATYSPNEHLVVGGAPKYPAVVDGAWVLQDTPGEFMRERVFDMFTNGTVEPDGTLAVNGMFFAVAPVDGYCHLIDP